MFSDEQDNMILDFDFEVNAYATEVFWPGDRIQRGGMVIRLDWKRLEHERLEVSRDLAEIRTW